MLKYILSFSFVEFCGFQLKRFLLIFFLLFKFHQSNVQLCSKNYCHHDLNDCWFLTFFYHVPYQIFVVYSIFSKFCRTFRELMSENLWLISCRFFTKFRKTIMILFTSAIWPSPGQLWVMIKGTTSPTQFSSLRLLIISTKRSAEALLQGWVPKPAQTPGGVRFTHNALNDWATLPISPVLCRNSIIQFSVKSVMFCEMEVSKLY